jgi:hypothetical protein
MNFDELRAYDRRVGAIADGAERVIPSMVGKDSAGTAATVLSHLVDSMASLKDGYMGLADSGNTYAACAILRIFLEHSLKAIAVFLQSSGRNFELTEGYMRLREAEAKEYLDALAKAGIEESELEGSPLQPWFDMGRGLSKSQKEKIKEPFTYRKLIDVIRTELGDTAKKSFLLNIIPNYSELSGFVHGGPTTAVMVELREANFLEDAKLVVSMFYCIKRYLLELAAAITPKFAKDHDRLNKALAELGCDGTERPVD